MAPAPTKSNFLPMYDLLGDVRDHRPSPGGDKVTPIMVKAVSFFKRKSGMAVEAFQTYWRARHPDVVTRLPGIRRYVQSHTLRAGYAKGEPAFDGIAEIWFDDTAAMRALAGAPAYAAVQADEAAFIDRTTMGLIITEEHVIKNDPVPAGAVKNIEFVTHRPGM